MKTSILIIPFICLAFSACMRINNPPEEVQLLLINEIMTSNSALVPSDTTIIDNDGMRADFVELYNAGSAGFGLHGLYVTDDSLAYATFTPGVADTQVFALTDTVIAPGNFYILWSGKGVFDTTNHMIIHLSRKTTGNEKFIVFDTNKTIIAQLNFSQIPEALITNRSYGRYPDGGSAWQQFSKPTPGFPNR